MGGAHRAAASTRIHGRGSATRLTLALGTALALGATGGSAWADVPAEPHVSAEALPLSPSWAMVVPLGPTRPQPAAAGKPDAVLDQIAQQEAAAELVAEKLDDAQLTLRDRQTKQTVAHVILGDAQAATATAKAAVSDWTRESFIAEASRPANFVTNPRNAMLGQPDLPRIDTPRLQLELAEAGERTAAESFAKATVDVDTQQSAINTLRDKLIGLSRSLRKLRAARASAILAAQRQQDARDAVLARKYLRDADESAAKPALTAVQFALAQRGKPYEWGTAGPNEYDCSGLVQTAYESAEITLPRTARPQYQATKPVPVTALLPGDLLFFATDKTDWNTIHHVGIYLGNGLMVHAPTAGDVVRVAPVWWSEFFSAGRVVAAPHN